MSDGADCSDWSRFAGILDSVIRDSFVVIAFGLGSNVVVFALEIVQAHARHVGNLGYRCAALKNTWTTTTPVRPKLDYFPESK